MEHKYTNELINSTSPYLLQHAHNPVDWHPWSEKIIEKAKAENKLLLVSIGYAACHWCHVMENESFEDPKVAGIMNENFICIKVDREERPEIDHFYMSAVHLMQQQGGWPLNVIALPDGRPVWGGTYFPKERWSKNILAVASFYRQNKEKTEEYAENLKEGIHQVSLAANHENVIPVNAQLIKRAVEQWKDRFDFENGGNRGAPKFPLPVNLDFLLSYGFLKNDENVLHFVDLTLEKMARGGIYDQLGGGFSRYSVDEKWKVPHFEKMLYDNGQLLSLYSKAFQHFRKNEYQNVVYETANFIERELLDESGAFYSSLDADSDGEEGKFYVWSTGELKDVLGKDYQLFTEYYDVNGKGFWEQGKNILLRDNADEKFAEKHAVSPEELKQKIKRWKTVLLEERNTRTRPGLDDKTLTSWNSLVVQGMADAYKATGDYYFRELATKNATFLTENLIQNNGKLYHSWKNGVRSVDGFLEDYALFIQALISLFEITGDETWLEKTQKLSAYTYSHFYNEDSGLFYFSEEKEQGIVTNHYQNEDNVIPAANSVMANNLYKLYLLLGEPDFLSYVNKMLHAVTPHFPKYPMAFANWGNLMLKLAEPSFEVAVVGAGAEKIAKKMQTKYIPNVLWAFSTTESELPVLKGRISKGKTLIYVCQEGTCQLPVEDVAEAEKMFGT